MSSITRHLLNFLSPSKYTPYLGLTRPKHPPIHRLSPARKHAASRLGSSTHPLTRRLLNLLPRSQSQDWCVAAAEGASVPEVHMAWCCRTLSEMELVGEALPSLLAGAGRVKDTHFSMSLYCSGKVKIDKLSETCMYFLLNQRSHTQRGVCDVCGYPQCTAAESLKSSPPPPACSMAPLTVYSGWQRRRSS